MKIHTRNSVYEVDKEQKLVRRLSGENEPCNFIGEDGMWQPYKHMEEAGKGVYARFFFRGDGSKGFITSYVTRIEED